MNNRPTIAAAILDRLKREGFLEEASDSDMSAMRSLIVEEIGQPNAPACEPPNGTYYVSTEDVRAVSAFLTRYPEIRAADCYAHLRKQHPDAPIRITLHRDPETGSGDTIELREIHVDALIDVSKYDPDAMFGAMYDLREPLDQWVEAQPWLGQLDSTLRVGLDFLPGPAESRLRQMLNWHGGSSSSYIGYRNQVLGAQADGREVRKLIHYAFEADDPDLPDDEWALLADYFEVREDWLRSPEPCHPVMRECWPEMRRSEG